MDAIWRGVAIYLFIWFIFRMGGKRSLAEITTFDFALLLIISETTQGALLGTNNSLTNCLLLIITMVTLDVALSEWKQHSKRLARWIDGVPLIILADGIPINERLERERIDIDDILTAARKLHGLERLEQIKYAVLERNGGITIIPREAPWLKQKS